MILKLSKKDSFLPILKNNFELFKVYSIISSFQLLLSLSFSYNIEISFIVFIIFNISIILKSIKIYNLIINSNKMIGLTLIPNLCMVFIDSIESLNFSKKNTDILKIFTEKHEERHLKQYNLNEKYYLNGDENKLEVDADFHAIRYLSEIYTKKELSFLNNI